MLDVLLVRIQPIDRSLDDFEYFSEKTVDFTIPVLNGSLLQFQFSKEFYFAPNVGSRYTPSVFREKAKEIDKELGVNYGGHVVAIDKYPYSQFVNGVKKDEEQMATIARYEIECQSENFDYSTVILMIPGAEPTVLSSLKIAFSDKYGFSSSSFIVFEKETVLSVKSLFGEVIGITLQHCQNESALEPNHIVLRYAMSFEKVSLPAVILQKLLETKPQADIPSDPPDVI